MGRYLNPRAYIPIGYVKAKLGPLQSVNLIDRQLRLEARQKRKESLERALAWPTLDSRYSMFCDYRHEIQHGAGLSWKMKHGMFKKGAWYGK